MRLIRPSFEIMEVMGIGISRTRPIELIEKAGRVCYKSEDKITAGSAEKFIEARIGGHESVIEHSALTVKIICDRGVTHELVRHRLCAFSQESTRYCNYKGGVTFIIPPWVDISEGEYNKELYIEGDLTTLIWLGSIFESEDSYQKLLDNKWTPQQARTVLPNSTKTEIVV